MSQVEHCVSQVNRFSMMLDGKLPMDRTRDVVLLQLGFNLGRYAELTHSDGRALWKRLERCSEASDYTDLATWKPANL